MMIRADEILALRGTVESRSKARALIEEGKVFFDGKLVDKPSRKFDENSVVITLGDNAQSLRFVSRAGLKLDGALTNFKIDVTGLRCIDIGASTGGFTDCLLIRGASEVVCVDVGSGQLHTKLANDDRVTNLEKTDIRSLQPSVFKGKLFDFACADLSFISLEKALPFIVPLLKKGSFLICLVKPQFESSPKEMRKSGGVIKDPIIQRAALKKIEDFAASMDDVRQIVGSMVSPISGGDGNVEFLICLQV